jgi:hypothetical protein
MPHANKIWMLYGFELFEALRAIGHEVIEVYPYAIARALLPECPHKRTAEGNRRQLESVAAATNWMPLDLERALVADMSKHERRAHGNENDPNMPFGFRDRLEVYPGPQARVPLRFLIDRRAGVRRDIDI